MIKRGRSRGFALRKAERQRQVMFLRCSGWTETQIANELKSSQATVSRDIKECIARAIAASTNTALEYKEIELIRCDESFGEYADMKEQIGKMKISKVEKLKLILAIKKGERENQDQVIKLRGLEAAKKLETKPVPKFSDELEAERYLKELAEQHPEILK